MSEPLTGLVAATFTPLHADGSLDLDQVAPMAAMLARSGCRGVYVGGSTGESLSLTVAERQALTEAWVAAAPPELRVVVHAGHTSLPDAVALAAHAQATGAAAVACMAPCFFRPATLTDLVNWCAEVAAAAPRLPFYYYHLPSGTGVTFPVADLLRAASGRIPNLAGAKYTAETLWDLLDCLRLEGGRYNLLFGRDEMLLAGLALGAKGAVGTTYSFMAPLYVRILEAFEQGATEEARALQLKSWEMIRVFLGAGIPPLSAMKPIMAMVGVDCGPPRPPLPAATPAQVATIRASLEGLGFFEYACR